MLAARIRSPDPLDELESHLRDDIEQRMASGQGAEAAFEAAVLYIGRGGALQAEFAKLGGVTGISRASRSLSVLYAVMGVVWLLDGMKWFNPFLPCSVPLHERLIGAPVFFLAAALLWHCAFFGRWLPVVQDRRTRIAVAFLSSIAGLLITLLLLQVVSNGPVPEGDLPPVHGVVLWAFMPWLVGTSLFFGLHEAARQKPAAVHG